MAGKRQLKFSSLLQKEMSEIFQKEGKDVVQGKFITITYVEVSPDLAVSKIYISFLNSENKDKDIEDIRNSTKKLRLFLGKRIRNQVKSIPEITFFLDDSAEYASRIDNLLSDLDVPPETKIDEEDYKK